MEFLVRIDVHLPPDMPADERTRLLELESARGRELIAEGTLARIWRIPGRQSNWSLYSAPDATAVHAAVTSLPLWPYMDVRVEPLAAHPLEDGVR
jgi:muconolactone D-isomerase